MPLETHSERNCAHCGNIYIATANSAIQNTSVLSKNLSTINYHDSRILAHCQRMQQCLICGQPHKQFILRTQLRIKSLSRSNRQDELFCSYAAELCMGGDEWRSTKHHQGRSSAAHDSDRKTCNKAVLLKEPKREHHDTHTPNAQTLWYHPRANAWSCHRGGRRTCSTTPPAAQ